MNIFQKIKAFITLEKAIKEADELFAQTKERQYVIPIDTRGKVKLLIVNRKNFRKLKQKGYISYKAKIIDVDRECFYHTPYKNGGGKLHDVIKKRKRENYYKWYDFVLKNK